MKFVIISDTGEQIEARCDVCRHWASLVEVGRLRPCGATRHAQSVSGLREFEKNTATVAPYFMETVHVTTMFVLYTPAHHACALFERKEPA